MSQRRCLSEYSLLLEPRHWACTSGAWIDSAQETPFQAPYRLNGDLQGHVQGVNRGW